MERMAWKEKLLDGEKRITSRYVPFFSKEVRLTSLFRGGIGFFV